MKLFKKILTLFVLGIIWLTSQGFMDSTRAEFYMNWADQYYYDKLYDHAIDKYKSAAKLKNGYAYFRLFAMYYKGLGTPKNETYAKKMLLKALELGDDNAQVLIAQHFLITKNGEKKAIALFKKAAKKENVIAYVELAKIYHYGIGVPKDDYSAQKYVRLASVNGQKVDFLRKTSKKTRSKKTSTVRIMTSKIQEGLRRLGFYSGKIDGYTGPMTKKSISTFQEVYGHKIDVKISEKVLKQVQNAQK